MWALGHRSIGLGLGVRLAVFTLAALVAEVLSGHLELPDQPGFLELL